MRLGTEINQFKPHIKFEMKLEQFNIDHVYWCIFSVVAGVECVHAVVDRM